MNQTRVSKVDGQYVATFPDGSRAFWPDSTPVEVIQRNVQETLAARQLWRPSVKVDTGTAAAAESVRQEAQSRGPLDQFMGGVGSAAQLARAALTQQRTPRSMVDIANELMIQLHPVSNLLSRAQDRARQAPISVAENKALASATPYSTAGNITGNVAITSLFPSSVGGGYSRLGATVPGMLGTRAGNVIDTALTSGVVNAALTPGSDEERLKAGLYAVGTSAIAPTMMAVTQGTRRALTRSGKQINIAEGLRTELGEQADDVTRILRQTPRETELLGTRPSSSMVTGSPTLEALEAGSRTKRGDLWRSVDAENASARWNALRTTAGTPEELAALEAARNRVTAPMRENALASASYGVRNNLGDVEPWVAGLRDRVHQVAIGSSRPNPDAQRIVKYVNGELEQSVTPSQLYTVRKVLTDKLKPGQNDELSNAAKGARAETMSVIKQIDGTLDSLSGGQWSGYLKRYGEESRTVESKRALQNIVGALERGQPIGAVPPALGEIPAYKTLGNLRDRYGLKEVGSQRVDRLLPNDREVVEGIIGSLKAQANAMTAKGILGSPTAGLLANAGRAEGVTRRIVEDGVGRMLPVPGGGLLASKVFDASGRRAEEELAGLLQDPMALAAALERARRARMLMQGAQAVGGASGVGGRMVSQDQW